MLSIFLTRFIFFFIIFYTFSLLLRAASTAYAHPFGCIGTEEGEVRWARAAGRGSPPCLRRLAVAVTKENKKHKRAKTKELETLTKLYNKLTLAT